MLQRCYTGLELRLELLVRYRAHTLELAITREALEVSAARCEMPSMKIGLHDGVYELRAGERRMVALPGVATG